MQYTSQCAVQFRILVSTGRGATCNSVYFVCKSCQHIPAIASSCPHWNQMSCNNTVDCNKQETTPVCNGPPQAIMRLAGTMVALTWNQFSLNRLLTLWGTALCMYYTLILLLTIRPGNRGESRFYVTGYRKDYCYKLCGSIYMMLLLLPMPPV